MLSANEVQQYVRDRFFQGLHKPLRDSLHYLYDDVHITYPQLVIAARKAKSEQENGTGESVQVKTVQAKGRNDSTKLSKQIVQL